MTHAKSTVASAVGSFGGRVVSYAGAYAMFDGVAYDYQTRWDCNEDADAFLETVDVLKSDRQTAGWGKNNLTVFFSLRGA